MIKKLNNYFICDEDQEPSATDCIFFYGISILMIIISAFTIVGLLKGVN